MSLLRVICESAQLAKCAARFATVRVTLGFRSGLGWGSRLVLELWLRFGLGQIFANYACTISQLCNIFCKLCRLTNHTH